MAMAAEALSGGFGDPARQSARAFRAALEAMARPGQVQHLDDVAGAPGLSAAAATLLLVLCDAETPLFLGQSLDSGALRDWLAFHTGAPVVAMAGTAMFAVGRWADLVPLEQFAAGDPEYPDRSATLIIEGAGITPATLTGPGIRDSRHVKLPELAAFRDNAKLFPLGRDFYFTEGQDLWALPRSSRINGGQG